MKQQAEVELLCALICHVQAYAQSHGGKYYPLVRSVATRLGKPNIECLSDLKERDLRTVAEKFDKWFP